MRKQYNVNGEALEVTGIRRRLDVFEQDLVKRTFKSLQGASQEHANIQGWLESFRDGIDILRIKTEAKRAVLANSKSQ